MNLSALAATLASPVRPADPAAATRDAAPPAAEAAAQRRKVAGQFEAILVRQLLSKSVGSMLGGDDVAGSVYGDMMTDVLAQNLTAGQGLGLGRMIEQQLTPRGPAVAAGAHPNLQAAP
jgi:Rod binding domain-containing protein